MFGQLRLRPAPLRPVQLRPAHKVRGSPSFDLRAAQRAIASGAAILRPAVCLARARRTELEVAERYVGQYVEADGESCVFVRLEKEGFLFTLRLLIGLSILAVAALLWFGLQLRGRLLETGTDRARADEAAGAPIAELGGAAR